MRSFRHIVVASLVAAAACFSGFTAGSAPVAAIGPGDIVALVVDGIGTPEVPVRPDVPGDVGTPADPSRPWTRILDADDLSSRYGLANIVAAEVVSVSGRSEPNGRDVVLRSSTGSTKTIGAEPFRATHALPSSRYTVRTIARELVPRNVAYVGDSVGSSAKSELLTITDGTFSSLTIDTLDSRFITKPPSPNGVEAAAQLPMNLDLVVVELGYNPSVNMGADIDAMMNVLAQRGAKRVIWINMAELRTDAGGKSVYATGNAALREARNRWPNLVVADWNEVRTSAGPDATYWFERDGVHLTGSGQAQFALWVRQILGASVPSAIVYPPSRRFAAGERIELQVVGQTVTGTDGVNRTIPFGAAAVALNITAVVADQPGYITVWPCDVVRPESSNLNYVTGAVAANSVVAPIGASGKVCFYSNQATDFLVDVAGWFSGASGQLAPSFVGATPRRVLDTRNGIGGPKVRVPAGGIVTIPLAGAAMQRTDGSTDVIPADVTAVAMNVTAVSPSQAGFITVWPCGAPMPVASNVNFTRNAVVANGVVTSLGANGSVCIYSDQQSDVLVDVLGWFPHGAGEPPFVGAVPRRLVDTRNAIGGPAGVVPSGSVRAVPVRGVAVDVNGASRQVPLDATAVALNVTAVDAAAAGYVTVWPCGTPMPEASNLNVARGGTIANGVIAPIGPDGSVCVWSNTGGHLIVDLAGWFSGGESPPFAGNVPRRLIDTRNKIGPGPW